MQDTMISSRSYATPIAVTKERIQTNFSFCLLCTRETIFTWVTGIKICMNTQNPVNKQVVIRGVGRLTQLVVLACTTKPAKLQAHVIWLNIEMPLSNKGVRDDNFRTRKY